MVCLDTSLGSSVLATIARLTCPHQRTRRARPGVAHQWTWMWTCSPGLGTRLSACMWWQPEYGLWVHLLTTPAVIRLGVLGKGRIAAGTSPALLLVGILILSLFAVLDLICMPLLDTMKVGYRPANRAGPDSGRPYNFVCAYHALVLSVDDVLMNSGGQVLSRRLGHYPNGSPLWG
jgi:hypothetical protein